MQWPCTRAGRRHKHCASRLVCSGRPHQRASSACIWMQGTPMKQVLLTLLSAARPAADEAPPDDDSCATAVSISRSYLSRLLATFGQERTDAANRALSVDTPFASRQEIQILSPTSADRQRQGAEPLSRQAQRVVRLLVAGQTYDEIAEALIVSPNTVKTQVSTIYRKLGVSRPPEAIAQPSRFHLLSST